MCLEMAGLKFGIIEVIKNLIYEHRKKEKERRRKY
jgi:hypothetical protein